MNTHAAKKQENKSQSVGNKNIQKQSGGESTFLFVDNRPEAIAQRKLQAIANNSPQVKQAAQLQTTADSSLQVQHLQSIQRIADRGHSIQMKWVDNGGELAWDQRVDGVQWFYIKETGQMYYRIMDAGAIKIGSREDYQALERTPKEYGFWKAHSAIDLDITAHLDPSVISPEDEGPGPDGGPTGMAAMDQGGFLATAKQVETGWGDSNPSARSEELIQSVNKYLGAAGVPHINFELKPGDTDSHGSFSESTWSITLNKGAFSGPTVDVEAMAEMADTVFHEARHAEQFYRIAQMLAALGHSVKDIRAKMVLNAPINAKAAAHAYDHPMPLDPNGLSTAFMETMEWYQSLYGARAALRRHTILTMKETKLQVFELMGQIQFLKTKFMLIKQDLEAMKMDTQFQQQDLQMERDEIVQQIKELESTGKGESVEAGNLRTAKTELEEKFSALAKAYKSAIEEAKPEMVANSERQTEIKEMMDQAFAAFEHWQELYKQLPEELDAWILGGAIQEAYKKLV
jgi:hypothetical protein